MSTALSLAEHLSAFDRAVTWLRENSAGAGFSAPVPSCRGWRVTDLVVHQGVIHRWAAANLTGDDAAVSDQGLAAVERAGYGAGDLIGWYDAGVAMVRRALHEAPDGVEALVFLLDAPPPRRFWARRQAHETTIHAVDALAALLGRLPVADEVPIDPRFAADGIDELLCGFLPRRHSRLRSATPYVISIRTTDHEAAWTVRVGPEPTVTVAEPAADPDALVEATAGELYLALWNRTATLPVSGRADVAEIWRSSVRVL